MAKKKRTSVGRRGFLKGAITGAAAGAAAFAVPAPQAAAQETRASGAVSAPASAEGRPGSDFMLDVFKTMGFEYIFSMPGTSFAGFHESVINYGGNRSPEFITCMHEESSVAMANGYFKIEGKPVLVCAHGTVGLQHAAMAIYDAFCDHVPVFIMLGNTLDATMRPSEVVWVHSVQDAAQLAREIIKWDDTPVSLPHFAESAMRAYKIAMTPPMGPVILVADTEMQEQAIPAGVNPKVPKLALTSPPAGDPAAVAEAAKALVEAENPVIVAGRAARTPNGLKLLVELAETLQAPVIDQHRRMNFPTRHPLNQTLRTPPATKPITVPAAWNSDLILGLESNDFYHAIRAAKQRSNPKLISISSSDLFLKSNYQNFQRYAETDMALAADAEATLPSLIEACKKLINGDRKRAFEARGMKLAELHAQAVEATRMDASYGWDASPISTARLSAELWAQLKNEDWSLVTDGSPWIREWPLRLWNFDKHYQYIGGAGGEGVGYAAPAAVGAAMANRKYGRISVAIQPDGDLMCANGILWTAAHHKIPLLIVMHNNRAYHQEIMGIQSLANHRQRGIDRCHIGTTIDTPNIDYAKLAQSMGVQAEGPIGDPSLLAAAIRRGIEVVKRGEPYLIDSLTQPR